MILIFCLISLTSYGQNMSIASFKMDEADQTANVSPTMRTDINGEKCALIKIATTQKNFSFPTRDEWKYAAKGGEKSQDYTYSGSNIISIVAWYSGNSDGKCHEVKQLQPNELGVYDMSGNLMELATSNGSYYACGGYFNSAETACTVNSTNGSTSWSDEYGLRLVLSNN